MANFIECSKILNKIKANVSSAVVVRGELLDNILICLCNEGHILLEDMPGTGKTTLAKAIAASVDASFSRVQCVPDILPSDITGINFYNQKIGEFAFRRGPVFANIVLADEINRASPRSQSALLEAMEERQISVDGVTHALPRPFVVIATQNPIETGGVFPLPEAQIDRFMMRLSVGYPTTEMERAIIALNIKGEAVKTLRPVCTGDDIAALKSAAASVIVSAPVTDYIIKIAAATRASRQIRVGASPRAAIALTRAAQARALLDGRGFVLPDDVKALAVPVLSHRIVRELSRSLNADREGSTEQIITEILGEIKAPVRESSDFKG